MGPVVLLEDLKNLFLREELCISKLEQFSFILLLISGYLLYITNNIFLINYSKQPKEFKTTVLVER